MILADSTIELHLYTTSVYTARKLRFSLLNVSCNVFGEYCKAYLNVDYSKLPASPPIDQVFLLDPLIATGGTACAALGMITDWGIDSKYPELRGSTHQLNNGKSRMLNYYAFLHHKRD